jgi:hypothetical protein
VRNTTEGEGLGGTTDEESDNSSPYEVEDGQGTGICEHDAGFDTNDGITDSYESTVNSLASLQLSNAAAITATSEDFSPPVDHDVLAQCADDLRPRVIACRELCPARR